MEHYALRLPAATVPAPAGTKVARTEVQTGGEGSEVDCKILHVVGFQSFHVYHYMSEKPQPVEAAPELMSRNGWHYRHCEIRMAPIAIEKDGRVVVLAPEEASWAVLPLGCSVSEQEDRCKELTKKTLELVTREEAAIAREEMMVEGD
jgi:hypothetical protein